MKLSTIDNLLAKYTILYTYDETTDKPQLKLVAEYTEVFGNNNITDNPIVCDNELCMIDDATSLTINENCRYFAQAIDYSYTYILILELIITIYQS